MSQKRQKKTCLFNPTPLSATLLESELSEVNNLVTLIKWAFHPNTTTVRLSRVKTENPETITILNIPATFIGKSEQRAVEWKAAFQPHLYYCNWKQ